MAVWVTHDLSTFIDGFDEYAPGDGPSLAEYSGGSLHYVALQPSSGTWGFVIPSIILPASDTFTFEVTQEAAEEPTGWAGYASMAIPPGLDDFGTQVVDQSTDLTFTTHSLDTASISDAYPYVVWNANTGARFTQIRTLVGVETPPEGGLQNAERSSFVNVKHEDGSWAVMALVGGSRP